MRSQTALRTTPESELGLDQVIQDMIVLASVGAIDYRGGLEQLHTEVKVSSEDELLL